MSVEVRPLGVNCNLKCVYLLSAAPTCCSKSRARPRSRFVIALHSPHQSVEPDYSSAHQREDVKHLAICSLKTLSLVRFNGTNREIAPIFVDFLRNPDGFPESEDCMAERKELELSIQVVCLTQTALFPIPTRFLSSERSPFREKCEIPGLHRWSGLKADLKGEHLAIIGSFEATYRAQTSRGEFELIACFPRSLGANDISRNAYINQRSSWRIVRFLLLLSLATRRTWARKMARAKLCPRVRVHS
jgi:hypothetical protein